MGSARIDIWTDLIDDDENEGNLFSFFAAIPKDTVFPEIISRALERVIVNQNSFYLQSILDHLLTIPNEKKIPIISDLFDLFAKHSKMNILYSEKTKPEENY